MDTNRVVPARLPAISPDDLGVHAISAASAAPDEPPADDDTEADDTPTE